LEDILTMKNLREIGTLQIPLWWWLLIVV